MSSLIWSFSGALVGSIITAIILPITINFIIDRILVTLTNKAINRDAVNSFLFHMAHTPPGKLIKAIRRGQTGEPLLEPGGSAFSKNSLTLVHFNPAQLSVAPVRNWDSVITQTVLGKDSLRPLHLSGPLLLDLPNCGVVLSQAAREAFLRAASLSQVPLLSGGQYFSADQQRSIPRFVPSLPHHNQTDLKNYLSFAAMVVLQVGVSGNPGSEYYPQDNQSPPPLQYQPLFLAWKDPAEFTRLVSEIKELTDGRPVAVQIVAGNQLESDLSFCSKCGVDVVILESRESDALLSASILSQNFGIPLLAALIRTKLFLERSKDTHLDIVASGSMWSSSDYLKALALGCSAVLVGQPALWALLHTQLKKVIPWKPLDDLYLQGGSKSGQLNIEKASTHLHRFLQATQSEIQIGTAAVGQYRIVDLGYPDLITDYKLIHELSGICLSYAENVSARQV